jgi:hypothetical protein
LASLKRGAFSGDDPEWRSKAWRPRCGSLAASRGPGTRSAGARPAARRSRPGGRAGEGTRPGGRAGEVTPERHGGAPKGLPRPDHKGRNSGASHAPPGVPLCTPPRVPTRHPPRRSALRHPSLLGVDPAASPVRQGAAATREAVRERPRLCCARCNPCRDGRAVSSRAPRDKTSIAATTARG